MKAYWSELKRGHPGSRFQDQYRRQHRAHESGVGRAVRIIAGVILIPVGLFFLPAPGPGMLVLVLGAVLIAREFEAAAKLLDRLEVRARQAFRWIARHRPRLARRHGTGSR